MIFEEKKKQFQSAITMERNEIYTNEKSIELI